MGEIRIVGSGKTRGYPYPVCKKSCYNIRVLNKNRKLTVESLALLFELHHVWKSQTCTNICNFKMMKYYFLYILVVNLGNRC